MEGTFTSKIKIRKKSVSQNSRNKGFSYHFWLIMEGSGSVPPTYGSGSGSGRPKNLRIRNTVRNPPSTEYDRCYPQPYAFIQLRLTYLNQILVSCNCGNSHQFIIDEVGLHSQSERSKSLIKSLRYLLICKQHNM